MDLREANWKKIAMFGAFGAGLALFLRGNKPAGIALAGVGAALLAAEHPEYFETLWQRAPEYLDRGSQIFGAIARIKERLEEEGPRALGSVWSEATGEARALARAISAVEDRRPESLPLLRALFPHAGQARVVGITGAPGAGKSTLVDQLARHYRGEQRRLGIVAVDPTSPFSGGAILGDRIRMLSHHGDSGIYIRSMATRGALGGLAATTADVATVLDASGRDLVLIETVGVGQDEVDIVRLADITVVILVPGMGDDVQTIKAGIMEIADIFVINKSDREGAERVEREFRAMQ